MKVGRITFKFCQNLDKILILEYDPLHYFEAFFDILGGLF